MPISLPTLVTCTPTIVRGPPSGEPAVAMQTLYAGRNPPSAIFITRASASVVDTRASFSNGLRVFWSSVTIEIASSTRRWKSRAPASRAALCPWVNSGSSAFASVALRCSAACSRHSSNDSRRRNDGAVAAARMRMPSCATSSSDKTPLCIRDARRSVISCSSAAPWLTRNADNVWWPTSRSPTIHRYPSSLAIKRAISRALPTPFEIAYSHSVNFICGDSVLRPTVPSIAFTPSRNAVRSSAPITSHSTRAVCVGASLSSGISNRITPWRRCGSTTRGLPLRLSSLIALQQDEAPWVFPERASTSLIDRFSVGDAGLAQGAPDLLRRDRDVEVADAEVPQRIDDRVGDRRRGADRGRLADAL